MRGIIFIFMLSFIACNRGAHRDEGEWGSRRGPSSGAQHIASTVQPKKHILVLNFWNDTPLHDQEGGVLAANELKRGLDLTGKVIIDEPSGSLSTENFIEGTHIKVAQLIREGKRLGVSMIAAGKISKITFRQQGDEVGVLRKKRSLSGVDLELKLFDVQNGREIMATTREGEAMVSALAAFENESSTAQYRQELTHKALQEGISKFIGDIVQSLDHLSWQGRIARLIGSKYYINAGKVSGLVTGDILRVLNPGEDLFDPTTGVFLGYSQGQLKGTLEVVDYVGTDAAVAVIHTGGNFKEGDFVQLY